MLAILFITKNYCSLYLLQLSEATLSKMMEGNLPKTLLHLNIFNYTSSSIEVFKVLMSLTRCTRLDNIELDRKPYDGPYTTESFADNIFKPIKCN